MNVLGASFDFYQTFARDFTALYLQYAHRIRLTQLARFTDAVFELLTEEIDWHITEYGVTEFIVGCYGNFNHVAVKAVAAAKEKYKGVRLTILLPYHPAERSIYIPEAADTRLNPFEMKTVPRRFAIVRANQYAVDHVDDPIVYVNHPAAIHIIFWIIRKEKPCVLQIWLQANLNKT